MTPRVFVTTIDRLRLERVLEAFSAPRYGVLTRFLIQELGRAKVVEPAAVSHDIATMNARVRFRVDEAEAADEATVVYPGREDSVPRKISVLTPVGAALLGLARGKTIGWRGLDGQQRSLTLLNVLYQPEANGLDHR